MLIGPSEREREESEEEEMERYYTDRLVQGQHNGDQQLLLCSWSSHVYVLHQVTLRERGERERRERGGGEGEERERVNS